MSDRIRHIAGLTLTAVSILICLICVLCVNSGPMIRFQARGQQDSGIPEIHTEQNGSIAVNMADADELCILPGIGETLSRLIISERQENGPYYYAEDLEAVKGIGPATLNGFRDMIDLSQEEGGE